MAIRDSDNVAVDFLGVVSPAEVIATLKDADAFLCLSEAETFGMGTLEAMACRRAVVTTPVGAAGELVSDGLSGFTIPVGDASALLVAVRKLEDPEMRAAFGGSGRDMAETRYNSLRVAKRWLDACLT